MLIRKLLNIILVVLGIIVLLFTCNTQKVPGDMFGNDDHQSLPGHGEKKWLVQTDSFSVVAERWIQNGDVYYRNLNVLNHTDTIFTDSITIYYTNFGLLPIVRNLNNGLTEMLMGFVSDKDYQTDILQFKFSGNDLISTDTLPMFDGNHVDYDNDGQVEFSGFKGYFPTYCFDCDSDYYRPKLFYEMSEDGMTFDSIASKLWSEQTFGSFHGFLPDSNLVVPLTTLRIK
ncbi:MAG: hypothetical protein IPM47_11515 [Sphingobacteriales bacterium]|nr:MAG: hypothetical protein IPM47_11515 [Sphingobacteriales bacterium]